MLSVLFMILFFWIFGKLLIFAFKASWGIFKALMFFVFLPFVLIAAVLGGLLYIALPVLGVVFVIGLLTNA